MRFKIIFLSLFVLFFHQGNANSEEVFDEVLTMHVWEPYAPEFTVKEFKKYIRKKYNKNIDVKVNYVAIPNEFFDHVRAKTTDIISPSHNFLKDEATRFIQHNLIIPIDLNIVTNLKKVESQLINNQLVSSNGRLFGVPFARGGYTLLYDKRKFPKAPDSWNVLWDPRFKGKYSLSKDYYESNIYITALALGVEPEKIGDVNAINSPAFKRKLKALLKNANFWTMVPKKSDVKDSVLSLAWGASHAIIGEDSKNWIMARPKEGMTVWADYLSVTAAVERSPFAKTLAMEWINYTLNDHFQEEVVIKMCNYISPLSGKFSGNDGDVKFMNENGTFWPILTRRNRNGLKAIYDDVMADIKKNP